MKDLRFAERTETSIPRQTAFGLLAAIFAFSMFAACGKGGAGFGDGNGPGAQRAEFDRDPKHVLVPVKATTSTSSGGKSDIYEIKEAKAEANARVRLMTAKAVVVSKAGAERIELAGKIRDDGSATLLDLQPMENDRQRLVGEGYCVDKEACTKIILKLYYKIHDKIGFRTVHRQFISEGLSQTPQSKYPTRPTAPPTPVGETSAPTPPPQEGEPRPTPEVDDTDEFTGRGQMGEYVGAPRNEDVIDKLYVRPEIPEAMPYYPPPVPTAPMEAVIDAPPATNSPASEPSPVPTIPPSNEPVPEPLHQSYPTPVPTTSPTPIEPPLPRPRPAEAPPRETPLPPKPAPTALPTAKPTAVPVIVPVITPAPTAKPTAVPVITPAPTAKPTAPPTPVPTAKPVIVVVPKPTARPTAVPTPKPTAKPKNPNAEFPIEAQVVPEAPAKTQTEAKLIEIEKQLAPLLNLRGGGRAVGAYDDGELERGSNLPKAGSGYQVAPNHMARDRHWGAGMMVSLLQNAFHLLITRWFPDTSISIGDIAKRGGGAIGNHASHQNGLDVDVPYAGTKDFVTVLRGGRVGESFDYSRNWQFFRIVASQQILIEGEKTTVLGRIFVHEAVKRGFCNWTKQHGLINNLLDADILRRLRVTPGSHDNHFHLRLKCSPHYPVCRQQAEPPPGTGC